MAKPNFGTELYKSVKQRGWQEDKNTMYPPNSQQALKIVSDKCVSVGNKKKSLTGAKIKPMVTGWIDDIRNIKNKNKQVDTFMLVVKKEFDIEVWPEFFFLTSRMYRFDYAIPTGLGIDLKIAIEVDGGIHMKGKSGHSSGKGIARDMDKSTLANVGGWTLIRRTPEQLLTNETIELLKQAIHLREKK